MNVIQKYFKKRQSLIDQYLKGDMTKREYLAKNYEAVIGLNIEPFKNIDTVEKGLFNYHYFNALAKDKRREHPTNPDGRSGGGKAGKASIYEYMELQNENIELVNYYYRQKDIATGAVLRLLDYKGVNAYFINVHSKYLKGKLYEIVLDEYDMILHSSNQNILSNLRNEHVFAEGTHTSLIDGYVNQKY